MQEEPQEVQPSGGSVELPHQLIEALGLLLSPLDVVAARSTCRTWRAYLSQRISAQPDGNLFELAALPSAAKWAQRVGALSSIFPNVKDFLLYVGPRVGPDALDAEVAALAAARPDLAHLHMRYLGLDGQLQQQGAAWGAGGSQGAAAAGGSGMAQARGHMPPRSLSRLPSLRKLVLDLCGVALPLQVAALPSCLRELRISTGGVAPCLTGEALQQLGQQLPLLEHLDVEVEPYTVGTQVAGLPPGLRGLALRGPMALGPAEVQALCSLSRLQRLSLELPSDRHPHAASLLARHPSLNSLSLVLDQEEADTDLGAQEVLGGLMAVGPGPALDATGAGVGAGSASSYAEAAAGALQRLQLGPGLRQANPLGRLTSLSLQSFAIPSQAAHFLHLLAQLTALESLGIAEPLVTPSFFAAPAPAPAPEPGSGSSGSSGAVGGLAQLSALTRLRSLLVALMPGFPIPALHLTQEAAHALSACTQLTSLTALNSVPPDSCSAVARQLNSLHELMLRPSSRSMSTASRGSVGSRGGGAGGAGAGGWGRAWLDLGQLPPGLQALSLTDLDLSQTGKLPTSLRHLALVECTLGVAAPLEGLGQLGLAGPVQSQNLVEQAAAPASKEAAVPFMGAALQTEGQGSSPSQQLLPDQLLDGLTSLQSLQLRGVQGLHGGCFCLGPGTQQLPHLTSLHVLSAPSPDNPLSQTLMVHCGGLTALKSLKWESWGACGELSEQEPEVVGQLARGARGLQTLWLAPAQEPHIRARTAQVVAQLLPQCAVNAAAGAGG